MSTRNSLRAKPAGRAKKKFVKVLSAPNRVARAASGRERPKIRARDPARTTATILSAAVDEFASRGYSGARVAAIARRAVTNKRMLYHYFGDKDGLYVAVLERTYQDIRFAERALKLADRDPTEAIAELVQFTWRYFQDHPKFLNLLGSENLLRAKFLKRSRLVLGLHSPLLETLAEVLDRGEQAGQFRRGIDPVQLYITIASLGFFYLSNRWTLSTIFRRDLMSPEQLQDRGQHILAVVRAYVEN